MLSKETILATSGKRKTTKLKVRPWDGEVLIRGVSAGEMDHIESMLEAYNRDPMSITSGMRATACAYFLADESGNRMFGDDEIDKLDALPASGLTVVFNEGLRFNKRAASIDELEKNSEPTPGDSSGTS